MWYRIPPIPHLLIGYTFLYTSLSDLSKIILLVTNLDTLFRILVLAIMKLSDQELSIALEEFERTMVDVSELFLPLLENHLDRTTICAAVESGAMRFAMFVWSLLMIGLKKTICSWILRSARRSARALSALPLASLGCPSKGSSLKRSPRLKSLA